MHNLRLSSKFVTFNAILQFQYVVIPTRRSTAEAFQILISHAFGDAGSPYLVGAVCYLKKKYISINNVFMFSVLGFD